MAADPPPVGLTKAVPPATSPDRDRIIDSVRDSSLLVVVLDH
jgi:hypothetical protein